MPDFDGLAPPKRITDPKGLAAHEYPRHLHRPDGTYCVVTNDAEKVAKLRDGWLLRPGPASESDVEPEPELATAGARRSHHKTQI